MTPSRPKKWYFKNALRPITILANLGVMTYLFVKWDQFPPDIAWFRWALLLFLILMIIFDACRYFGFVRATNDQSAGSGTGEK